VAHQGAGTHVAVLVSVPVRSAELQRAGDAFQRPLRSRFQARLTRGVRLTGVEGRDTTTCNGEELIV
jgi:hypothetical protein